MQHLMGFVPSLWRYRWRVFSGWDFDLRYLSFVSQWRDAVEFRQCLVNDGRIIKVKVSKCRKCVDSTLVQDVTDGYPTTTSVYQQSSLSVEPSQLVGKGGFET